MCFDLFNVFRQREQYLPDFRLELARLKCPGYLVLMNNEAHSQTKVADLEVLFL